MLGFAFGSVFYLLNILKPDSFAVNNTRLAANSPDLMYFSFVTLATLGYGDITPVANAGRALVQLEAVVGRAVYRGLHGAPGVAALRRPSASGFRYRA